MTAQGERPADRPESGPVVEVWFDGAWIRAPDGSSRLYGYGYRITGAGFDISYSHPVITGHLVNLVGMLIGMDDEVRTQMPAVIRSIHVADLEAALSALVDLKKAGYAGTVRLLGDSKSLIERLARGDQVRPDAADAPAIAYREKMLREVAASFESVELEWVPREQNREADALAWQAVHEVIEHKKVALKSARSHPERGPWVPLAEFGVRALIPGDVSERDIDQMQCLCRTCRPGTEGERLRAEE